MITVANRADCGNRDRRGTTRTARSSANHHGRLNAAPNRETVADKPSVTQHQPIRPGDRYLRHGNPPRNWVVERLLIVRMLASQQKCAAPWCIMVSQTLSDITNFKEAKMTTLVLPAHDTSHSKTNFLAPILRFAGGALSGAALGMFLVVVIAAA